MYEEKYVHVYIFSIFRWISFIPTARRENALDMPQNILFKGLLVRILCYFDRQSVTEQRRDRQMTDTVPIILNTSGYKSKSHLCNDPIAVATLMATAARTDLPSAKHSYTVT